MPLGAHSAPTRAKKMRGAPRISPISVCEMSTACNLAQCSHAADPIQLKPAGSMSDSSPASKKQPSGMIRCKSGGLRSVLSIEFLQSAAFFEGYGVNTRLRCQLIACLALVPTGCNSVHPGFHLHVSHIDHVCKGMGEHLPSASGRCSDWLSNPLSCLCVQPFRKLTSV